MNTAHKNLLTKFASGELDASEEAEFLVRCECEPELWREATLSLVEHRQLVASLRAFAIERKLVQKQVSLQETAEPSVSGRSAKLVLVATLLITLLTGLTLGYWGGLSQNPGLKLQMALEKNSGSANEELPSPTYIIVTTQESSDAKKYLASSSALKPESSDPDTGASFMDRMETWPENARAALRKAGFEADEEMNLVVFDDGSGERWAIPTRNYHLRYVSHQD